MNTDLITVTAYKTEEDFNNNNPSIIEHFSCEDEGDDEFEDFQEQANNRHTKLEDENYYLVTSTNDDGKLVR